MTYKEATLSEYISSYNQTDITFASLHLKEKDTADSGDAIILLSDNIITKYKGDLEDHVTLVTLTTTEFNKYQYNPKVLSYDLYGTTELWTLILDLNQLYSTAEFSINPIKLYDTSILNYIGAILNLEKPIIDSNIASIES